jgi:hypothetical protein
LPLVPQQACDGSNSNGDKPAVGEALPCAAERQSEAVSRQQRPSHCHSRQLMAEAAVRTSKQGATNHQLLLNHSRQLVVAAAVVSRQQSSSCWCRSRQ